MVGWLACSDTLTAIKLHGSSRMADAIVCVFAPRFAHICNNTNAVGAFVIVIL